MNTRQSSVLPRAILEAKLQIYDRILCQLEYLLQDLGDQINALNRTYSTPTHPDYRKEMDILATKRCVLYSEKEILYTKYGLIEDEINELQEQN